MAVRERLTVHASLAEFSALFDATVEFVTATERLCGHQKMQVWPCYNIKVQILTQLYDGTVEFVTATEWLCGHQKMQV
jgi:hypothetical protein